MMEKIFKLGDKVFDHSYGWGEIVNIDDYAIFPIRCKFISGIACYTYDGKFYDDVLKPSLSFTEYTLSGFSQERPKSAKDNLYEFYGQKPNSPISTPYFQRVFELIEAYKNEKP